MIASGLHESTDDPPNVRAFHQGEPKQKRESLTGARTGAVEAFARAMGNTPKSEEVVQRGQVSPSDMPMKVGISLGKAAELQGLYNDNIFSDKELAEQKCIILEICHKNM